MLFIIQIFLFRYTVTLVGKHEDRVFDEREVKFNIGEVPDDEVLSGIQIALLRFNKGETSRYHAYGQFYPLLQL